MVRECESHMDFCPLAEFKQKMQHWWDSSDDQTLERTTGLHKTDYLHKNGSQTFVDACNEWWASLDYEGKRTIYNREQS